MDSENPKPKTIWTKSKWTLDQLDRKSVEFKIPTERGIISGTGEFWVRRNPEKLLAIEVSVTLAKSWAERIQYRFQIPQAGVDRIEAHPDQSTANFRLM